MRVSKAFLVCVLIAAMVAPALGQGKKGKGKKAHASVSELLSAGSELEKGRIAAKLRGALSVSEVMQVVRGERFDTIAGTVVGNFLEQCEYTPAEAAEVLTLLAQRPGQSGFAAVEGATSGHAASIAAALVEGRAKTGKPQLLAAEILAAYALVAANRFPEVKGSRKSRADKMRQEPDALAAPLGKLLRSKEPEVLEAALLACARLKLKAASELIQSRTDVQTPGVLAAKMLYLASVGADVPDELVKQVFAASPAGSAKPRPTPSKPVRSESVPRLCSYEVRTPPWSYGCEAIGLMPGEKWLDLLHQSLEHRDLRVQIDAARAIERVGSERSVPFLLKKVQIYDLPWPVAVHVFSAVGAIPSKDSIGPLIDRLGREKGRLRLDVNYALASIAGEQHGETAKDWKSWFDENGAGFAVDKARTKKFREAKKVQNMRAPALGSFYTLDIYSDRVVFTVDASNSMHGQKISSLKHNLTMTIAGLDPEVRFNIVHFGGEVGIMEPGRLISKSYGSNSPNGIEDLSLTGGTRMYDAAELAMNVPGMDTIILLSDGAPVAGKFDDWRRLIAAVGIHDRYWPVAVWGLAFDAKGGNMAAMEELAGRNWGRARTADP